MIHYMGKQQRLLPFTSYYTFTVYYGYGELWEVRTNVHSLKVVTPHQLVILKHKTRYEMRLILKVCSHASQE
jgi:hypothetical protein